MMMRRMGLAAVRQTPCSNFGQLGSAVEADDADGDGSNRAKR
eukprot:COSAG01_NODE_58245_length_307_cov_0.750000_1_plen_41_part_10